MRAKRYLGGVSRSAHRVVRSLEESLSSGDVSLESGDIEDDSMSEAEAILCTMKREARQKICKKGCATYSSKDTGPRLQTGWNSHRQDSPVSYIGTFSTRQEVHMRATGSYVCGRNII